MRILRRCSPACAATPPDIDQLRLGREARYDAETAKGAGRADSGAGYSSPIDMDDFRPPH
jgi:hypothetical protein